MPKKKKAPVDGTSEARFPLDPPPQYATMCETALNACETVKKAPNYNNDPVVQAAVASVEACVTKLKGTNQSLTQAHLEVQTLEPQQVKDAAALHRANGALESAVTTATNGVHAAIVAYGGTVPTRTPSTPSTDPPTNPTGKSRPGSLSATFSCKSDSRAYCYHYAWGNDPGNPDAWTNSAIDSGCHYTVGPFPAGQKVYGRIAVQRRKSGRGTWSGVIEVIVR
jgi:hypothetical protein